MKSFEKYSGCNLAEGYIYIYIPTNTSAAETEAPEVTLPRYEAAVHTVLKISTSPTRLE